MQIYQTQAIYENYLIMDLFGFDHFLEARVEILKIISSVFWLKLWHQKENLKLTEIRLYKLF